MKIASERVFDKRACDTLTHNNGLKIASERAFDKRACDTPTHNNGLLF